MVQPLTTGLGALLAIATVAGAAAIPATASAQSYAYDQCQRDNANRGLAGGAIGGLAGGVIGNQASARGRHTENTLLGAAIGGVAGALIGRGNTSCPPPSGYAYDNAPPPAPVYDRSYDNRGYDNRGYDDRAYDQGYNRGYADSRYDDRYYAPPPPPVRYYAPPPVYVAPPPVYVGPSVYFGFGGGGRRW